MKKTLYAIFAVVFGFTVSGCSQNVNNFEYTHSEMEKGIIITDYNGRRGTLNIPSQIDELPVTRIGLGAFWDKGLTRVTIPDSIISIGQEAFSENKLKSVTIPDSVTNIWAGAFLDNQLTSITIGSNVSIKDRAFESKFDSGFVAFYQAQGRKAGTYTLRNGTWNVKYR